MGQYVQVDDVLNYLYIEFGAGDNVNRVQQFRNWIDARILEAEEMLRETCRTSWHPVTTTEYMRRVYAWEFASGAMRNPVIPSYQPLQSVQNLEIDFGNGYETMQAGVDYIVRDGIIFLIRKVYRSWTHLATIKITYTYGYNSVPTDVKGAIIRMVAIELFNLGNIQPFLNRIPTTETIKKMEEFVQSVINRYSMPQLIPK